jgi:cobalamin-dependent methionine synthase I
MYYLRRTIKYLLVFQATEKLLEYAQSHSATEKTEQKAAEWRAFDVKRRLSYALVKVRTYISKTLSPTG